MLKMQRQRQASPRGIALTAALLTLTASLVLSAEARAEPAERRAYTQRERAQLSPFAGTYRYAEPLEHGRAIVRQAFEEAIEGAPALLRPALRKRMSTRDYLVRTLALTVGRDRLGFRAVNYRQWVVTTHPGQAQEFRSKQGNVTTVVQHLRPDGRLEQIIRNRRGRMHNVFTLVDDGQILEVTSTITSPLLDRPINVELRYRREPQRDHRRRARPRRARARRPSRARPAQLRSRGRGELSRGQPHRAAPSDQDPERRTPGSAPDQR